MTLLATSDAITLTSRRGLVAFVESVACAVAKPMLATRAATVNIVFMGVNPGQFNQPIDKLSHQSLTGL
jgi:hypothetical protein